MKTLIVISSKSPNPNLYDCVNQLYKIQIKDSQDYKICIVDSDSDDFIYYNKIQNDLLQQNTK
jgi:hypothetical protein